MFDFSNISVRVINLDKRTDRWAKYQKCDTGFPHLSRFPAINAMETIDYIHSENVSEFTKLRIVSHSRRSIEEIDSVGAIGCTLSHVALWKELLESNDEYMIILEDDLNLGKFTKESKSLRTCIEKWFNELPTGWDVWLLGKSKFRDGSLWSNPKPVPQMSISIMRPLQELKHTNSFVDVRHFTGTNGYMINRRGAHVLLEKVFPIEVHVDAYISLKAQLGHIRIIAHPRKMLPLENSYSDITHKQNLVLYVSQFEIVFSISLNILLLAIVIFFVFNYILKKNNRELEVQNISEKKIPIE